MPESLFDLTGKVAVVTGSSRGIGKAIATRMAEHGAKVVISSRKADACAATVDEINALVPDAAVAIPCHVAHKDELQALVDQTYATLTRIDILVCNASVNPYAGPMSDCPDDAFDAVINANIRSTHWLAQMVLPEMRARRDGVVIIVSSIGGFVGSPQLGAYAMSKAAEMQLARNIAVEYGPHNVRANCIAPGFVRTDFSRLLWEDPAIRERATSGTPLRRIGEPDEIAGVAVMLAAPAGAFLTGQTIVVDGGALIAEKT